MRHDPNARPRLPGSLAHVRSSRRRRRTASRLGLAPLLILGVLLLPLTEGGAAEVSAGGGVATAFATGRDANRIFFGPLASLSLHLSISGQHALGAGVLVHQFVTPENQTHAAVSLQYRYTALSGPAVRLSADVSAGLGAWWGCVRGDYCDGLGPMLGLELAIAWQIADGHWLSLAPAVQAQLGMVNAVDAMLVPQVTLALTL